MAACVSAPLRTRYIMDTPELLYQYLSLWRLEYEANYVFSSPDITVRALSKLSLIWNISLKANPHKMLHKAFVVTPIF